LSLSKVPVRDVKQKDHYYPFGATINALSSTAPLSKPNRYKLSGNEEQVDFDWNVYDFGARNYDPILGRFMQVDPMADSRVWINPYNYVQNNPLTRVDPEGTKDWYTNEDGGLAYDETIKSQKDLDAAGIKGTYQGTEGWAINESNGNQIHYTKSGHTNEVALNAGEVTVTANPVEMGVYKAHKDFAVGSLELTSDLTGSASTALNSAALVVAPFAPPVAGAMLTISEGLDKVSVGASLAADGLKGELSGLNVSDIAGLAAGELLDNKINKSGLGRASKVILKSVGEVSIDISTQIVAPAVIKKK
jgi:RHS repeat-associated protein